MKNFKKVLALVLALATLLSFATVAGAYTDVAYDTDYSEAIEVLSAVGVLEGNTGYAGAFRPKDTLTREEAAKLIAIFDNGSTDIADLYTSTNPFADVIGRWSASYVGYCYRAGIVVGPRANMFDPKANVTGTQFLKMALTVLDYDAEKEGLVGASWDVNAIKLAKDVGLTDGLAEGWLPEKDLTRGEAAQIMYNAFFADTVEYGSAIRYFADDLPGIPGTTGDPRLVTVAGAYPSGHVLCESWKVVADDTKEDAFRRPVTEYYKNGKLIYTRMQKPLASWTSIVDGCDMLVASGIAKTKLGTARTFTWAINGAWQDDITLKHTPDFHCEATYDRFGYQGTLTQLFKIGTEYRVTEIDTWLAKVSSVKSTSTTNKSGHKNGDENVVLYPFYADEWDENEFCEACLYRGLTADANGDLFTTFGDASGLAKGDYVLINFSFKTVPGTNNLMGVQEVVKASSKSGVLNGFKDQFMGYPYSETKIGETDTPDSLHFHAGYDISKSYASMGDELEFFFDKYGNVIGCFEPDAESAKYLVADKAWGYWTNGDSALKADVVFLDASKKNVEVASFEGYSAKNIIGEVVIPDVWHNYGDFEDYRTYDPACKHLLTYSVDKNGAYVLDEADVDTATSVYIDAGDPNIFDKATKDPVVRTNEYTQYLLYIPASKTYVAYTGYKDIESCELAYVEYIEDAKGNYAEIVFGIVSAFVGDSDTCFVTIAKPRWSVRINGVNYDVWTVFKDGVETTVYTRAGDYLAFTNGDFCFYDLSYVKDENGVVVVETKLADGASLRRETITVKACKDTSLYYDESKPALNVTDVPVYVVDGYFETVKVGTLADVKTTATVTTELIYKGTKLVAILVTDFGA